MTKVKVTLTLDKEIVELAKKAEINLSATFELYLRHLFDYNKLRVVMK